MAVHFAAVDMLRSRSTSGVLSQEQMIWPATLQQEEPIYILVVDKFGVQQTTKVYTLDTHRVQGGMQHATSSKWDNLLRYRRLTWIS